MKRAVVQSIEILNQYRAVLSGIALGACLVAAFFYALNLYTLITQTVAIGALEKESATVSGRLSTLGAEYLKQSSEITPDRLAEYGLKPGQVTAYINRPYQTASIGGNLARGGHEL